jgi:beta-propeller repeat-containing protein
MRTHRKLALALVLLAAGIWAGEAIGRAQVPAEEQSRAVASYGRLPLHFERNQDQTDERVKFLARGRGYELFLTSTESVLVLHRAEAAAGRTSTIVRIKLLGANPHPAVEGRGELSGKSHYLIGSDRRRWRTNISQYAQVEYADVYPGVSLAYYGDQHQLEYDFVVKPGADPGLIRLGIEGVDEMRIDAHGNLHLSLPGGEVIQRAPVVYQEVGGFRKPIPGRFVLRGEDEVAFEIGPYDTGRALVLDPVLIYSTYLGGSDEDAGLGIALDVLGNVYLTGQTLSTDFPTANALQRENAGALDAFVAKLNVQGSALVYSTYLGGSDSDLGERIAVDTSGRAYVTGETQSTDFPTAHALQREYGGIADAFVAKLDATGSALLYSTYLGGGNFDAGMGIAVDEAGNAAVVGRTSSTDFPTANALQAESGGAFDAFVAKLDTAGAEFTYSTYLGGSENDAGMGIAMDGAGHAYVTGATSSSDFPTAHALQPEFAGGVADAFITRLNSEGSDFVYSTYLGGSGFEVGNGIAVELSQSAHVTGYTTSTDFPTFRAFQTMNHGGNDAFVTKLNAAGSALLYSTYLGGSGDDVGYGVAVDTARRTYITGYTASTNFPTRSPLQAAKAGGWDAFVTKLNTERGGTSVGSLLFSTYLGGNADDVGRGVAVERFGGNAYVGGYTVSTDFPTRNALQPENAGGRDAFVSKIGTGPNAGAQGQPDEVDNAPPDRR